MKKLAKPRARPDSIEPIDIDKLVLDPENPRLDIKENPSELDMLKRLYEKEALDELAWSLFHNSFFWEEPLVVVENKKKAGTFIVVEGNRRLATLKLLLDKKLRDKVGVDSFPTLSSEQAKNLQSVPTVVYPSRADVVPYLGFRHITGVKNWDPFAKARYVASLIEKNLPMDQIEEQVGDSGSKVRKLYQAYVTFEQVRDNFEFDLSPIKQKFSFVEVALGQTRIKSFLGVSTSLPVKKTTKIVPDKKLDELGELISFLFGDVKRGIEPVISDSRQISQRLSYVLEDEEALEYLRKNRDLEGAYERSGGEREFLIKQLSSSKRYLERAMTVVAYYPDDSEVRESIKKIKTLIDSLVKSTK